jgi:drug/metabolite transporter (DMT)-like permease
MPFTGTFWPVLPSTELAFWFICQAIRVSPLSLAVPYLGFAPVFMIATGYLFLDEIPNLWGVSAIITTCVGGYILNL